MISKTPRILICGGRDFSGNKCWRILSKAIDRICQDYGWITKPDDLGNWLPAIHVISGAARGADTLAHDYAVTNWLQLTEFPADWKKYGRGAGHIRNQQMIDEGKPDFVIAFPGGKGTANMVARAGRAHVPVIIVDTDGYICYPSDSLPPGGDPGADFSGKGLAGHAVPAREQ